MNVTLDQLVGRGIVLTTVERRRPVGAKSAIWPMIFGLACCAIEMMGMVAPGSTWPGSAPGSSAGRPASRTSSSSRAASPSRWRPSSAASEQMPEPKWVLAMGACASCGGVFNNYAIVRGPTKLSPSTSTFRDARRPPDARHLRPDGASEEDPGPAPPVPACRLRPDDDGRH